jgi:predicted O-methyltransferase YrrM
VTLLRLRDLRQVGLAPLPTLALRGAKSAIKAAVEERLEDDDFRHSWQEAANTAGWLGRDAARVLFGLARDGPGEGRVVEVGAYLGRSTIVLADGLKARDQDERVVSIDPHDAVLYRDGVGTSSADTMPLYLHNLEAAGVRDRVLAIRATSADAAKGWDEPVRLLYVDALHDTASVLQDIELWTPHIAPCGVIVFDDFPIIDVQRALAEGVRRGMLEGPQQLVGAAAVFGLRDVDDLRLYAFPKAS